MKKFILIGLGAFLAFFADAQSTTATNVQTIGQSNFLGYTNNYPLLSKTAATNRMKLNGNINYALNGYNASRNGNLLIGISNNSINSGQNIFTGNTGAFSLLHINGPGSGFQEFGYRPWMQTGVTFTGNRDLSYFGLRKVGTGEDITETTIAWADNNAGNTGPDDMVFRFLGAGTGSTAISSNLQSITDLDGLHIARFAPTGEFGLGNTFGVNAPGTPAGLYVRPASLAHYSLSNYRSILDTEKTE